MRVFLALLLACFAACGGSKKPAPQATPTSPQGAPTVQASPDAAPPPASPADAGPVAELLKEADDAWAKRADRGPLQVAITFWERAQVQLPNDPNIATNLARAYYFLGDGALRFADEADAMLDTFEKGILAGQRALMGQSGEFASRVKAGTKVEDALQNMPPAAESAMYWYASNLGKYAATKGLTTMLFYRDRIYAVMQRALAVDETFYHAGPHRYFGAFYAKAPSFAGGDLTKAKQHFDKALSISPTFFGTKVLYAELYAVRADDKALFTKLLKEVVDGDPKALADLEPEQRVEQEKARRLLAQTEELF